MVAKRKKKKLSKTVCALSGIIIILVGIIVFLCISWNNEHLKQAWGYYFGTFMGSGVLVSILPSIIEAIKTKNANIILDDLQKAVKILTDKKKKDNGGKEQ